MRRKYLRPLLALVAVLVVGGTAYWHTAARRLESGFQDWAARSRAMGWTISTGGTAVGGWPLAATLTVSDLVVTGGAPAIPGGFSWDAQRILLRVDLLQPWSLDLMPIGVQRLRFGDGMEVPFVADTMHAALPLSADAAPEVDVAATRLRALLPVEGDNEQAITIEHLRGHADIGQGAKPDESAIGFSISAETIGLPAVGRWPLGRTVAAVTLEATLEGPLPEAAPPVALATAWRDAGGSLQVQKLAVTWGPLDLTATATLALDDQLQPMGAGTSRIVGYAATLDALASNGVLTRSAATAAKAVLSLLANAPPEGEAAEVDVPLTLQYRTLSMRQVPLVRLPELDWPAP